MGDTTGLLVTRIGAVLVCTYVTVVEFVTSFRGWLANDARANMYRRRDSP